MSARDGDPKISRRMSEQEAHARSELVARLRDAPIPEGELLANLPLFLNRQTLSRLLFLHDLYRRVLPVHGVIMEFGVRWGRDLALFESFRGIYEPYNYSRRIIGFDTFSGFPPASAHDNDEVATAGAYGVSEDYAAFLDGVLKCHELESPMAHIDKYELVSGDATTSVQAYLERHPETVVALAYFDFDLYEPTKAALEAIGPYLTKGSIIGFDELGSPAFPGETVALREVLGLDRFRIERFPFHSFPSFLVVE